MRKFILIVLAVLLQAGFSTSPFQPIWDSESMVVTPGKDAILTITVRMPPHHFLYQDKTTLDFLSLEGVRVKKIQFPKPVKRTDPVTGHDALVYEGEIAIDVMIEIPAGLAAGEHDLVAVLAYQGCSDKLCLRPEETRVQWTIQVPAMASTSEPIPDDAPVVAAAEVPTTTFELPDLPKTAEELVGKGLLWAFGVAFIGGILTSFTPCVLPLLPITLLVIGVGAHRRRHHNLGLAVMLTLGMTVSYALMGSLAAVLGLQLGFLFQSKWFLGLVIAFFVVMSGAMLGFFHLQMPLPIRNALQRLGGQGPLGAFLAGFSMGFLAAPCVGPVMGALLAFVGLTQNVWLGFLLLCTFALGMGTLFVVVGTFYGYFSSRVRRPQVANVVKKILGILLLLPALYYLNSFVPWMDYVPGLNRASQVAWVSDPDLVLLRAQQEHKPILVDFSAKWCAPCVEMDRTTFRDPAVVAELNQNWIPWKVDATFTTPALTRILDQHKVMGWPTLLFLNSDGVEFPESRRVGEVVPAVELLLTLQKLNPATR